MERKRDKSMTFIEKFFNGTIRPSDIRFVWSVNRIRPTNWNAVKRETAETGLDQKINSGELDREAFGKLVKKHTSSNRWEYSLYRKSSVQDKIVDIVAKMGMAECEKIMKTSKNWSIMRNVSRNEAKKSRIFSSLSAAQKWADRHSLGIDVYSLWESKKRKIAQEEKEAYRNK